MMKMTMSNNCWPLQSEIFLVVISAIRSSYQ